MIQYSTASAREDGAENRVVMTGKGGYLGYTSVRLPYLEGGWIELARGNREELSGWKLISTFSLEPGTYTLAGIKSQAAETIAHQLHIVDETGITVTSINTMRICSSQLSEKRRLISM